MCICVSTQHLCMLIYFIFTYVPDTGLQQVYVQQQEQVSAIGGLQSEVGAMRGAIKELQVKQGNK